MMSLNVAGVVEGKERDLPVDRSSVVLERDGRVESVAEQLARELRLGRETECLAEEVDRRRRRSGLGRGREKWLEVR